MITTKKLFFGLAMLLTLANSAWALDSVALDKLLEERNYSAILSQIDKDNSPEALAWLRKHYREWHQPVTAHFAFSRVRGNPELSWMDQYEIIAAGARAYVMMEIDKSDCKDRFAKNVSDQVLMFNIGISPLVEKMRTRSFPQFNEPFKEALAWGKVQQTGGISPAAVWLCGEGNILPDDLRFQRHKEALAYLTHDISGEPYPPSQKIYPMVPRAPALPAAQPGQR